MVKFRKQKQIILWLNPDVYAVAKGFNDNRNCPIATAVKMQFSGIDPKEYTGCSPDDVTIAGYNYDIIGSCGDCQFVENARKYNLTVPIILKKNGKTYFRAG